MAQAVAGQGGTGVVAVQEQLGRSDVLRGWITPRRRGLDARSTRCERTWTSTRAYLRTVDEPSTLGEKVSVAPRAARRVRASVGEKRPAKSSRPRTRRTGRRGGGWRRLRRRASRRGGEPRASRRAKWGTGAAVGRGSPEGWTRGWRRRLESPIDPGCESHAPPAGRGDLSCWHSNLTDCEADTPQAISSSPGHQLFSWSRHHKAVLRASAGSEEL